MRHKNTRPCGELDSLFEALIELEAYEEVHDGEILVDELVDDWNVLLTILDLMPPSLSRVPAT
jgi:hypothetical protein